MAFEFKLPDIGEGVVEGEIVKWLVEPGQDVREDDPIVEVMTDKATVELTSPKTGVIGALHAEEGQTVEVGAVLVEIEESGESASKPEPAQAAGQEAATEPAPKSEPEPAGQAAKESPREKPTQTEEAETGGKSGSSRAEAAEAEDRAAPQLKAGGGAARAMPAVRRLARELDVDVDRVPGSGPGGRVLEEDVRAVAKGAAAFAGGGSRRSAPVRADEKIPFRGLRRKIAEKMAESKHNAAHFTYVDEVDCTRLVQVRKAAKEKAAQQGIKLTYLAFLAKAVARGIEEHPILNASLDEEAGEITVHGRVHIGIAVDTDNGLIVPVVKDVQSRGIYDIAREIERLAEDARNGRSKLDDLTGSTFTITSVGSLGGMFATPIINYPEVAILGVNRIEERPVVRDGEIQIRHMTYFSISLDHRVVDGADGARFMNTFKSYVEEPSLLLLEGME